MTLTEILRHERANNEIRRREALSLWRASQIAGQPRHISARQFTIEITDEYVASPPLHASNTGIPGSGSPSSRALHRPYRPRSPYFQITLRPDAIEVYYKRDLFLTIEQDTPESKREYDRIRENDILSEQLIARVRSMVSAMLHAQREEAR